MFSVTLNHFLDLTLPAVADTG